MQDGTARRPTTDWRIHLGAHKTATTHFQRVLEARRPDLRQDGIHALTPSTFRPIWTEREKRYRRWRRLITAGVPVGAAGTKSFLREIGAPNRPGGRIVLSEENIIGDTRHGLGAVLYPDLSWRVGLLRSSLGGNAQVRLFFSIRNLATFLPSIYAEALRFFAFDAPFETVAAAALAQPPRWTDVVARLRTAWPEASVSVWRYEDYAAHDLAVFNHVTGCTFDKLPSLPRPRSTMTPSEQAVRAAEREAGRDDLDIMRRKARVAEIYAAAPATKTAATFRPLTPPQVDRCTETYEADCAALAASGLLWTPEPALPDHERTRCP